MDRSPACTCLGACCVRVRHQRRSYLRSEVKHVIDITRTKGMMTQAQGRVRLRLLAGAAARSLLLLLRTAAVCTRVDFIALESRRLRGR